MKRNDRYTLPNGIVFVLLWFTDLGRLSIKIGPLGFMLRIDAVSLATLEMIENNSPAVAGWDRVDKVLTLFVECENSDDKQDWPAEVKNGIADGKMALGADRGDTIPTEEQAENLAASLHMLQRAEPKYPVTNGRKLLSPPGWHSRKRRELIMELREINAAHAHLGEKAIGVGDYKLYPAAGFFLLADDLHSVDVLVNLAGEEAVPENVIRDFRFVAYPMADMGSVASDWESFLRTRILPLLEQNLRLMPFCRAGHGRTGTFIASLIALLEPTIDDPIEAARQRYCRHAVESLQQAEAIFALLNSPVPQKYVDGSERLFR
ncbi:MAG: hypothetical protein JST89_24290 [Cyanobacteria bacterium SZAS-4]|nr:hypothetical protein [Cyanobacteria bacterium SZAS-4]